MTSLTAGIHWLGHDSFRIEANDLVIYIDPWELAGGPAADLILITHEHGDHCSPVDVAQVRKEGTTIVTIAAAAAMLPPPVTVVTPGMEVSIPGASIKTVPAYNLNKFRRPGELFHPPQAGHVGFILSLAGRSIYHAGDTDCIPEMDTIEADVALLPVSGTYVMTPAEAVEAAARIKPRLAIPMHVAGGIGSMNDAEWFRANAGVPTEILEVER